MVNAGMVTSVRLAIQRRHLSVDARGPIQAKGSIQKSFDPYIGTKVCYAFKNTGACHRNNCPFSHDVDAALAAEATPKAKAKAKAKALPAAPAKRLCGAWNLLAPAIRKSSHASSKSFSFSLSVLATGFPKVGRGSLFRGAALARLIATTSWELVAVVGKERPVRRRSSQVGGLGDGSRSSICVSILTFSPITFLRLWISMILPLTMLSVRSSAGIVERSSSMAIATWCAGGPAVLV